MTNQLTNFKLYDELHLSCIITSENNLSVIIITILTTKIKNKMYSVKPNTRILFLIL